MSWKIDRVAAEDDLAVVCISGRISGRHSATLRTDSAQNPARRGGAEAPRGVKSTSRGARALRRSAPSGAGRRAPAPGSLPQDKLAQHWLAQLAKGAAVVLACVGVSTLLALALQPALGAQSYFLPFTLAIIASAWYGGFVPGMSATALSFLVADLFLQPAHRFFPLGASHFAALGLFLAVGLSISVLHRAVATAQASLRAALERLDEAAHRAGLASLQANIDLTQRRELEESLRERSEQLSQSHEQLERFASTVSHDLQEPLRAVTAMTELFLSRAGESLDRDSRKMLELVLAGAGRMKQFISDILQLARVSSDSMPPMAQVNLEAPLEAAIHDLMESITASGARIDFDLLPDVYAHEGEMARLFQNLIGNAIKYRGERPPEIYISAAKRHQEWIFCVKDNGIGIEPRHQQRIFELFFRAHAFADRQGTGVGLAICKRIVERHNGRIWVESEPEKGSQFFFSLPVEARPTAQEPYAAH